MDLRSVFALGLLLVCCTPNLFASANVVFKVKHKFGAGERNLAALKAHDDRRHGRSLAAVDLPLGGNGSPTDTALAISLSLSCIYTPCRTTCCYMITGCCGILYLEGPWRIGRSFPEGFRLYFFKVQEFRERINHLLRHCPVASEHWNLFSKLLIMPSSLDEILLKLWIREGREEGTTTCCFWLYYTKIGIGTPSKDYYMQVDTGSDIMWVNCAGCDKCPTKSNLGVCPFFYLDVNLFIVELSLYDPKGSTTGTLLTCDQDFCIETFNPRSCKVGAVCAYGVTYGDGSSSVGYFVKDNILLDRASGNLQTTPMNGSIAFGCGASQSGQLDSSTQALDGILGFGQANSSMISQLALDGKVSKMFAHCLDGTNGGGIFAIGQLVQPKLKSTPLVPNQYVLLHHDA
ncbi:eukaryotic aspartyl protease family protein [Actinidia rufa]|uniref:Eukaryotic aspartyl protease family protein n=1 Tax=Actinidia rufa TaxID=165716 RepID=A0A7J0GKM7_9ERIC|nr:eukaryotic aspartyl protease family protein [Actinidia rufa]